MRARTLVGVALASAVVSGVTSAAIPDSATSRVTVCVVASGPTKGAMRAIDAEGGVTCPTGHTRLSWQSEGLRYRGAWKAATRYSADDVVSRRGTTYVALRSSLGSIPVPGLKWAVFTTVGPTGVAGEAGATGPTGAQGQVGAVGGSCVALGRWDRPECQRLTLAMAGATDVAFDGSHVWVSLSAGSVKKLDPRDGSVVSTVSGLTAPRGLVFDGSSLWVATGGTDIAARIDIDTATVVSTVAGVATTDGRYIAWDGTSVWVASAASGSLVRVDPGTEAVVSETALPGGDQPYDLMYAAGAIWVSLATGVGVYDLATEAFLDPLAVDGALGLAFDGPRVWATGFGGTAVIQPLDAVSRTVEGPSITVGTYSVGLVHDGTRLWVLDEVGDLVLAVDTSSGEVVRSVAIDAPQQVTLVGSSLWVTTGAGTVERIPI